MTPLLPLLVASLLHAAGMQSGSRSDDITALMARAESALASGDLERAQPDFERAAALDADNPAPLLGLCEIGERRGELFQALELCRQAQQLAPGEARAALNVGRLLIRIGAASEALGALTEATRLDPNDPTPYILSALLLRDGSRHKDAIAVLERAIAQGVGTPEVSEELSLLLLTVGERPRAEALARQGLQDHPHHPGLTMALGLTLTTSPEGREEAAALLSEAVELDSPHAARLHLELGKVLMDLSRTDEAITHLREGARLLPESAEAHYRLATALRASGDLAGAQIELERFQALSQARDQYEWAAKQLRVDLNEAQKLAFENRLSESLDLLGAVLVSHPQEPRAHALQAKVLASLGRIAEALESIVQARELGPQVVEYHYLEGRFLVTLGRFDEAAAPLRQAVALDPSLAPAHELLGIVAANEGRHEEAVILFRRALELGGDTATLHLNLAEALRSLGRLEESEQELEAYRRRNSQ